MRRRREISELGEHALIERLGALLPGEPRWVPVGRGEDDCAAVDLGGSQWTLVTCDAQVEGTHFRREWIDPLTLGRRAATVNLSDIAAMGGEPRAAVVSMLLPRSLQLAYYDAVMRGLGARLAEFGAALVGGNLARSTRHITIDVTLLGRVRPGRCIRRSGARPGDRVLVTGSPGESCAGLLRLRHGARRRDRLVRRFLDPEPRVQAGRILASGGVTAMIDVSDGVAADLANLCRASGAGAVLRRAQLPVSPALQRAAKQLGRPVWDLVLAGGEDYELLCTAPARRVAPLQRRLRQRLNLTLHDIGEILPAAAGLHLEFADQRQPLESRGFEHFR
jgi:thiamine-monophosphate kinase